MVHPPTQTDEQVHQEACDQGGTQDDHVMEEEAPQVPPTQVRAMIQRNHPVDQILGDISKGVTTHSRLVNFCEHYSFVSSIEPFRVEEAVGAKAKTPPFARSLRCSRWSDRDKSRQGHPSLNRHQTKTCDDVIPQCGLVQLRGPRVIRPIVTGPAWPPRVTGLICKGIPIITVCNPALWEYSGDNLGS
jgi:hypothetical protein